MAMIHPANIITAACGLPYEMQGLEHMQCAWVPASIARGLLEHVASEQKVSSSKGGASMRKDELAPKDWERHQQMLHKFALHLAGQPEVAVPPVVAKVVVAAAAGPQGEAKKILQSTSNTGLAAQAPEAATRGLSAPDQAFQQEMLRKLALHLAAQEAQEARADAGAGGPAREAAMGEASASPECFPATPSSFGEAPCEHYFIGEESTDVEQDPAEQSSYCCWPASSQLVSVPVTIAHGLLRLGRGHDDHDFHQQMLQKLALHLAAQEGADEQHLEAQRAARPPAKGRAAEVTPKVAKESWADILDDDESFDFAGAGQTSPSEELKQRSSSHVERKTSVAVDQQLFQQEMLRRLAVHLAAPDGETAATSRSLVTSDEGARALGEDKARCDQLLRELAAPPSTAEAGGRFAELVDGLLPVARSLSLTPGGSRVVQQLLEVASEPQREQLVQGLLGPSAKEVHELCVSPHANHVLAKLVAERPQGGTTTRLAEAMRGQATTLARHQFGSRILERLVEHGLGDDEEEVGALIDEVLEDVEALARHQFGNFVVARLLRSCRGSRQELCVRKLLPHVLQHATHKIACNIVQRIMENSDLACQALLADAFLAGTGEASLEAIAATRYGSFVVQHLVDRFHPRIDAVKARVKAAHAELQKSGFSQRKIVRFLGEGFFRE